MFSHVCIGTNDFRRAQEFYAGLFDVLGHPLRFCEPGDDAAAWQPKDADRPLFFLTRPFDGSPATVGNGQMIALIAASRAEVDRCHAVALANGATCEGPPGLRPHYHAHYYGAYLRDPDGNTLCICCHLPE
ncbi:VOC family protein [soil metagenome]